MKLVEKYETQNADNETVVVEKYDNGTTVKTLKSSIVQSDYTEQLILPAWEEAIYETQTTTEYVACLMELQTM